MLLTRDRGEIIKRVVEYGTLLSVMNTASCLVYVVFSFEFISYFVKVCHRFRVSVAINKEET
jgi:hypothetical protein